MQNPETIEVLLLLRLSIYHVLSPGNSRLFMHTRNIILKDLPFTNFVYTENFTQGKRGL